MDFAGLADHREKIRENKKKDNSIDIAREKKSHRDECGGGSNFN